MIEVECIAGCDRAPSMMVNDKYYEPMDEKKLDGLLDRLSGRPEVERVLLARVGKKDSRAIDGYIADGGYGAWKVLVGGAWTPEQLTEEVKKSGLRGRGGAGFPTGVKWGFVPKDTKGKPIYLLCNADESEPGTFKDRLMMEEDPHQLIEGMILSAYAIKCQHGLHLHPRRVLRRRADPRRRRSTRRTPRASSARTSSARASTSTSPCTAAPAPTSAARRPA